MFTASKARFITDTDGSTPVYINRSPEIGPDVGDATGELVGRFVGEFTGALIGASGSQPPSTFSILIENCVEKHIVDQMCPSMRTVLTPQDSKYGTGLIHSPPLLSPSRYLGSPNSSLTLLSKKNLMKLDSAPMFPLTAQRIEYPLLLLGSSV